MEAAGGDSLKLFIFPYDAGCRAMTGFLPGETQILSLRIALFESINDLT